MKQLYKTTLFIGLVAIASIANAQESQSQSFTLDQSIEYALTNSINAQNSMLDQKIASAKVKETVGIGLPQVTGSGNLTHNAKLQRFFTRYDPVNGFIKLDPSQTPAGLQTGDVIAAENFFQLKNTGTASLNINQLIFSGSYIVGLQASKTYKELSEKSTNQTKELIIQQVTKAFYNVLINKERAALFTDNIARVDSLLRSTTALNKNGLAESIDVDRIQVTYNNLKAEQEKFLRLSDLSVELLKFQMNYPMDQSLAVVGKIEDVKVETSVDAYEKDWDYKVRPDYKTLETNKRLQELNIKNLYSGALPTISAFGTLGYNTQSADFAGLFKTNTNISDANGLGPDKWYSYSMFGVNLSMPIFTGFQRHQKIQQERLSLLKIENNFKSLKQGIDLETKQASANFQNAITSLASQKANMELAGKVARVTKIKYEQGVGSNLEVVDAENSLRQSQTNYYSALFDAMVAKVDLDKAYGRLLPQTQK
jgi:outer membrane protein TolC